MVSTDYIGRLPGSSQVLSAKYVDNKKKIGELYFE